MTGAELPQPHAEASNEAAAAIFQREWRIYRKMVENNYLFHCEAYAQLRRVLLEEASQPFRFLDLACGDATAVATALEQTGVANYCGVDLSADALRLAERSLANLPCPKSLRQADYVEALANWREPVDVIWIGLSRSAWRATMPAPRAIWCSWD